MYYQLKRGKVNYIIFLFNHQMFIKFDILHTKMTVCAISGCQNDKESE